MSGIAEVVARGISARGGFRTFATNLADGVTDLLTSTATAAAA
jgi:hypothetical protein